MNKLIKFLKQDLESYQIDKEIFKKSIKNIFPSFKKSILSDKMLDRLSDNLYDYFLNDAKFSKNLIDTSNNITKQLLNELYYPFITKLDQKFPNNFIMKSIKYDKDSPYKMIELEKAKTVYEVFSNLMLIENLKFLESTNDLNFIINTYQDCSISTGSTIFRGMLAEQINVFNTTLLPLGIKKNIKEIDWIKFINTQYPNNIENQKKVKSFDLYINDKKNHQDNYYELKNLFLTNNLPIYYFKKKSTYNKIKDQLKFEKETGCNTFYYLNNTRTNEKILIPLKDMFYLIKQKNQKITFNQIRYYVKNNFPENYQKTQKVKKISKDINLKEFFENTIHFFQKNITEKQLKISLNSLTKKDFYDELDREILSKISSKKELYDLFIKKNEKYIPKEEQYFLKDRFNIYINDNFDFNNKTYLNLAYFNLKHNIDDVLELKGRSKISLDKTNIEQESRSRKIINTMKEYNIPMDTIFNKSYESFLKSIIKDYSLKEIKENIPKEYSDDFLRRIRPYITKKDTDFNLNKN